ncbi:unnamed protein product [Aphanomyces euteiches]
MAAHKNPRHTDRSAKLYWRRLQLYQGEEPDQEAMSPVDELFEVVEEKLRRAGQMASDFIRSGAVFPEDKVLPFVSVELPSDKGNRPDQWFHGIPPPKTMFMWEGEPNASFWKVTPQIRRLQNLKQTRTTSLKKPNRVRIKKTNRATIPRNSPSAFAIR